MRDFFEAFPDFRVEIDEQPIWHVMEWRNEKCVRWRSFRTEAEALGTAGPSE